MEQEVTVKRLLEALLDEGIIKSIDELTDEKIEELVKMLKEDKTLLIQDKE